MVKLEVTPDLIMQRNNVLRFTDPDFGLKFIDSLSFLGMPLSHFPKALGFSDKAKGYFLHKFSSEGYLRYIGPYPPPSNYDVERFSDSKLEEFFAWYATVSGSVFNFEKEALYYCRNDVDILLDACTRLRQQFIDDSQVDPVSCITIASTCIKVFHTDRRHSGYTFPTNYRRQCKKFSVSSIQ